MPVARLLIESGVIWQCTESFVTKIGGKRVNGVSAEAINYPALVLSLVEEIEEAVRKNSAWVRTA